MNNLDNVRRFVDTFPLSITDDAEFESKHKRDKEGKFSTQSEKPAGCSQPKTYYATGKNLETLPRKKPLSHYIEMMANKDPYDVTSHFVEEELRGGYVQCNLPKIGPVKLEISRQVAKKLPDYVKRENDPIARQTVARRTMIVADSLSDIIKTGRRSEWQPNNRDDRHIGDEFLKILKAYNDIDGSRFLAVATIRKPNNAPAQSYAVRVKGGQSLKNVMIGTKFKDDASTVELVDLKILDK